MHVTQKRLDELRATISHVTIDDLTNRGVPAEAWIAFAGQLGPFAKALPNMECLACGEEATFTWGLAHGEGHCNNCGWPARLYHFIKYGDDQEARVVLLLQYHPDGIEIQKREAA